MVKRSSNKVSSKKMSSLASSVLKQKSSTKKAKSLAGSVLSQAKAKRKKR